MQPELHDYELIPLRHFFWERGVSVHQSQAGFWVVETHDKLKLFRSAKSAYRYAAQMFMDIDAIVRHMERMYS